MPERKRSLSNKWRASLESQALSVRDKAKLITNDAAENKTLFEKMLSEAAQLEADARQHKTKADAIENAVYDLKAVLVCAVSLAFPIIRVSVCSPTFGAVSHGGDPGVTQDKRGPRWNQAAAQGRTFEPCHRLSFFALLTEEMKVSFS